MPRRVTTEIGAIHRCRGGCPHPPVRYTIMSAINGGPMRASAPTDDNENPLCDTAGGRKGRPYENSSGDAPVGADDSVGPIGDRIAIIRADTPRALVPLRFTALVVRPCIVIASQCAHWRGNPFSSFTGGDADSHTSDVGHWFGMTGRGSAIKSRWMPPRPRPYGR